MSRLLLVIWKRLERNWHFSVMAFLTFSSEFIKIVFNRINLLGLSALFLHWFSTIWATSQQNQQSGMCAQRRLRSAWASALSDQSSLCAQWVAKDPSFLHADSKDPDQTGRMPRLIWVFAGRTCHFVGFVMRRLIYVVLNLDFITLEQSSHLISNIRLGTWI